MKYIGDRISSLILLDTILHSFGSVNVAYQQKIFFRCAICLLKQYGGGVPAVESSAARRE